MDNNNKDFTTPEKKGEKNEEQEERSLVQQEKVVEGQEVEQERDSGEDLTLGDFLKESEKEERLQQQLLENSKCKFQR